MSARLTVVVVEDHDLLRETTVMFLREHGYQAIGWDCAESVDVEASSALASLYLIDLNLPGENGLELSKRLRKAQPDAGIVMVTARSDVSDRIQGYDSGADIYMAKPVEAQELLAVIRSLAVRILPARSKDGWSLERCSLTLTGPSGAVKLTHPEVALLCGLVQTKERMLARDDVARHFNLTSEDKYQASLNVRLSQLRKKLRSVKVPEPSLKSLNNRGLIIGFELALR